MSTDWRFLKILVLIWYNKIVYKNRSMSCLLESRLCASRAISITTRPPERREDRRSRGSR